MLNLILQEFVPVITAFVLFINSVGGLFGISAVVPYNPERTDVVLSGEITTDVDEILDCYNAAVKKTGFVLGTNNLDIIGTPEFTVSGMDNLTTLDMDAYWEALDASSAYIFEVPGEGELTPADVKSAKMCDNNGEKTIIINVKDYKHGLNDSEENPMTNAYGFVTDMEEGFAMAGLEVIAGDAEISYTNATISCVIDDRGKIIYGDWDLEAEFVASEITFSMFGYTFTAGKLNYKMAQSMDI